MTHPAAARIAREDPLHARVLAELADDGLRAVWADSLLERGDPLGELISIDLLAAGGALEPAQDKHRRSLITKHVRRWLAELADVVQHRRGLVLDRGVMVECQVQVTRKAALAAAVGHPLWAGVRNVCFLDSCAYDPDIVPLLVDPVFRELRAIVGVGLHNALPALARHGRPLPFTEIWTLDDGFRSPEQSIRELRQAPGLPALRTLGFYGADHHDWITELPIVRQLHTLGIGSIAIPSWMTRTRHLENLTTLELRPGWIPMHGDAASLFVLRFARGPDGSWSSLEIDARKASAWYLQHRAKPDLATIPADALRRIAAPSALHPLLRRFKRAELVATEPEPVAPAATPAARRTRKPATKRRAKS